MAVKKLTKEQKKLLVGLMPLRRDAEHTFVPSTFEAMRADLNVVPTITVKQWDNRAVREYRNKQLKDVQMMDKLSDDSYTMERDIHKELYELVNGFVVGWSGFIDTETGDSLPYSHEELKYLPQIILTDIIKELAIISGIEKRS